MANKKTSDYAAIPGGIINSAWLYDIANPGSINYKATQTEVAQNISEETIAGLATIATNILAAINELKFKIDSVGTPTSYLAAETITDSERNLPVSGNGGAVILTSNPQITIPANGVEKRLRGTDDVNTLTVVNGNGLRLENGLNFTLGNKDIIDFVSDGSVLIETYRSDN